MKRIVEVCAGSYQDCLAAYRGGAQRAELNSALSVGGLTPSVAALRRAKQETSLKIICMVRPRAAGFCYDKAIQGAELIRTLQERFGKEIEILAGSGINAENARSLMEQTGIWQVHSSCKDHRCDPTTEKGPVSYAYLNGPHRCDHDVVSETLVRSLVQAVQED